MKNYNNLKQNIKDFFTYKVKEDYKFKLTETDIEYEQNQNLKPLQNTDEKIYSSLDINLEYIQVKYNTLINSDIKIREFNITIKNKVYKAFLLFIDGMVDNKLINNFVLKPLMRKNKPTYNNENTPTPVNNIFVKKVKKLGLEEYIYNSLIPQNEITKETTFKEVFSFVNSGDCALFIDTIPTAFVVDVKGYEKRSIDKPSNEIVIKGPQESFVETLRTNTSMLRRLTSNENLIIENLSVGTISNTSCAICYIKGITNEDLIAEVKYRINNIDIDYLLSSGQLEQLIEDNSNYNLPQILSTERPDKVSGYLLEGRVAVILNGSPYALVMPATLVDFITTVEDNNLKFQFANVIKIIRILALAISLLLPAIYIGMTNFHQELLPTELLFAIVASRTNVPFPILFEVILMEISLELIREAGIRVPSPLGQTIGIVGGIILSDAAVSAQIVSPILIIIIAITGISTYAIPDFTLSYHIRICRFIYILLAYFAGFLGIAFGLFIHMAILCTTKSFGIPYLAPFVPIVNKDGTGYFSPPFWQREQRADVLNTKRPNKESNISMKWKEGKIP